jgi:hypothetical protein
MNRRMTLTVKCLDLCWCAWLGTAAVSNMEAKLLVTNIGLTSDLQVPTTKRLVQEAPTARPCKLFCIAVIGRHADKHDMKAVRT